MNQWYQRIKSYLLAGLLSLVNRVLATKAGFERVMLPWVNRPKPGNTITEEALLARFPRYLAPPACGVRCGAGWFSIVWDICNAVEGLEQLGMPRGTTLRAEEKLGGLFIKVVTRSLLVRELARQAELRAAATCEECGAPGQLQIGRGFAKTLCEHHAQLRQGRKQSVHPLPASRRPELIFIDTEFTDFDYPQLISIGLISQSGERFYAEMSNGWSRANCSDFVVEQILPQLTGERFAQERSYVGQRLATWLDGHGGPVRMVTDAPGYDWSLMMDLLEGRALTNLIPAPLPFYSEAFPELAPLLKKARSSRSGGASPHHALNDAESLREAWEVMERHLHPAVLDQYLRHC